MPFSAGWLLLQTTVLMSVVPTEYSSVPTVSRQCQKRIVGCGEFQAPKHEVGRYDCTFNSKSCDFMCVLKCPQQSNGVWMTLSNKRFGKESYVCSGKLWKRRDTPKAFCIAKMPVREVKQNFHHVGEVNNLINTLFSTSYIYIAMASFYDRADVALPGFTKLMTRLWEEEITQARNFMSYINKRGGYINLADIPRPSSHEMLLMSASTRPGLVGLEAALNVTRDVNELALNLHTAATKLKRSEDPHLKFYLEEGIISQKTDTIKKLADWIRQLRNFADEDYDIGEYILDIELAGTQAQA